MSDPIVITTVQELQNVENNLTGDYVLGGNINASGFNFTPIGTFASPFTGSLDGNGYTINGLSIKSSSVTSGSASTVGLFGVLGSGALVSEIALTNESVAGPGTVGGLVGYNQGGTITASFTTGTVSGVAGSLNYWVGGLVGYNDSGTISGSYSAASVTSPVTVGHLGIGGLAGGNQDVISQSYATGPVTGSISGSDGTNFLGVGGFVGQNQVGGLIANSYSTGPVTVNASLSTVGGIVSFAGGFDAFNFGQISDSYGAGAVIASPSTNLVGGFIASSGGIGTTSEAYWDTQTSGQAASAGGTAQTTAQLDAGLPSGFDPTVWGSNPSINNGFPYLLWQSGATTFPSTWANDVSGNWSKAANWSPNTVPGSDDDVSLPAFITAYAVTSSASVEVASIAIGAGATLNLTAGTFTTDDGTGLGINAGTVKAGGGATLNIDGSFYNSTTGVISATGKGTMVNLIDGSIYGGAVTIGALATLETIGGASSPTTIGGDAVLTDKGMLSAEQRTTLTLANTTIAATGGTIEASGLSTIVLGGATINGGTLTATGSVIATAAGTDSVLKGVTISLGSAVTVVDASTLTLEGTITNDGTVVLSPSGDATELVIGANVTLTGGGFVALAYDAANQILGPGSAAESTLTNTNNTISGTGSIGDGDASLTLVNKADGTIDATGAQALTIDTGNKVTNAGLMEASNPGGLLSDGGLVIDDAVDNSGTIQANGANVTIMGALTGAGQVDIFSGNTVTLGSSATNGVTFEGGNSSLILQSAQDFSGKVAGFVSTDTVNLTDFSFATTTITNIAGGGAAGSITNVTLTDSSSGLSETLHLVNATANEFGTALSDYSLTSSAAGKTDVSVTSVQTGMPSDIQTAETMINAQVLNHAQEGISVAQALYLTNEAALVDQIASDLDPGGLGKDYSITGGYINPFGVNSNSNINPDWDQCVAVVLGLDFFSEKTLWNTTNWTNGNEQVDVNGINGSGGFNPNIAPGTPIATFISATGQEVSHLSSGSGEYPIQTSTHQENNGQEHAAIFLGYGFEDNIAGFFVLDQAILTNHPAEIRFIGFNDQYAKEYYNIVATDPPSSSQGALNQNGSLLVQSIASFVGSDTGALLTPRELQSELPAPTILAPNHHG